MGEAEREVVPLGDRDGDTLVVALGDREPDAETVPVGEIEVVTDGDMVGLERGE